MSILSSLRLAAAGLIAAAGLTAVAVPAVTAQEYTKDNPLKVVLVVHGNLGDKSFFDSAAAGVNQAAADLPVEVRIIEAGLRTAAAGSRRSPTPPTAATTSSSPAPSR